MYAKSARFYDVLYGFKDYAAESLRLAELIQANKSSSGSRLLDVACGTGKHIAELANRYVCTGVEIEPAMAEIARERVPGLVVHEADMCDFHLGVRFDVVTCLFSAIGYAGTVARLDAAVGCMARHLEPGGVLIVEPWIRPDNWHDGAIHASFIDEVDLKIARMVKSEREGEMSIMDMHHLVVTPAGVNHFVERHEMMLFTDEHYLSAFEKAGLTARVEPDGLMRDRGLIIGHRA